MKLKVGRDPAADEHRLDVARQAVGPEVELYVDANGAYERREAHAWTERFAAHGVTYVEEPVSSDDLDGLRLVRDRSPAPVAVAAGEYAYDLASVARMLPCVDVQQVDVTRCGGITELLRAGALCEAAGVPLSAHCAPALSAHACCGVQRLAHLEHFHDHVRLEAMLFDGTLQPDGGSLRPDRSRAGHGLTLRGDVADRFAVG